MDVEEGDIVFFVAGAWESICTILGRVRLEVAGMMELTKDSDALNFLWVVDFPLLAYSEEDGKWVAVHHPFTRPNAEDIPLLEAGDYAKVRAVAYDVVLNGYELGGGSHPNSREGSAGEDVQRARRQPGGAAGSSSATSSTPSASAPRRTAASRSASTASPCSSPARTASAK